MNDPIMDAPTLPSDNTQATAEPLIVDTRPIFARGETPCAAIENAQAAAAPGQPIVVLVPFEPVPLYAKFGKQGYTHKSERQPDGSWRVEFTRPA